MTDIHDKILGDNYRLRSKYLATSHFYSPSEIQSFSKYNQIPNIAESLESRKIIFSVSDGEKKLYPSFQFQDDEPREIINDLLSKMPSGMSSWNVAFWFYSGNGYLDGKAPQESLESTTSLMHALDQLLKENIFG